ncbi:hypothetical protein [Vreelandella boliviensis]|jgi:hypothetical protein|nr:hypothetical protein [Halomonas boliviensis]
MSNVLALYYSSYSHIETVAERSAAIATALASGWRERAQAATR